MDHRIAMAFAIAALRAESERSTVLDCDHVATSFPVSTPWPAAWDLQITLT